MRANPVRCGLWPGVGRPNRGTRSARGRAWGLDSAILPTVPPGAPSPTTSCTSGAVQLDPPTLVTLGVQLLVSGDDDHDAPVAVRYRAAGAGAWRDGAAALPRAARRTSPDAPCREQFAGSIFDLAPGDDLRDRAARDRSRRARRSDAHRRRRRRAACPAIRPRRSRADRRRPRPGSRPRSTPRQPGDVITLADGVYAGTFALDASGTAANPIVIRGASRDGTILDGGGCAAATCSRSTAASCTSSG